LLALLLFLATATAVVINKDRASFSTIPVGQVAAKFTERDPIASVKGNFQNSFGDANVSQGIPVLHASLQDEDNRSFTELASAEQRNLDIPLPVILKVPNTPIGRENEISVQEKTPKEEKKNALGTAIETVMEQAKKIGKKASWQVYATPSMGYRRLKGEASGSNFQYSVFSLSTNAMFARNVKDAVSHKPGMGFEIGTAMFYPLAKKLNFKAGLQANCQLWHEQLCIRKLSHQCCIRLQEQQWIFPCNPAQ
jgi:hypothetical protein